MKGVTSPPASSRLADGPHFKEVLIIRLAQHCSFSGRGCKKMQICGMKRNKGAKSRENNYASLRVKKHLQGVAYWAGITVGLTLVSFPFIFLFYRFIVHGSTDQDNRMGP